MEILEFLKNVPVAAQAVVYSLVSVFIILAFLNKWFRKQAGLVSDLKEKYTQSQIELISLMESDSQKSIILTVMKQFCNECYEKASEHTGIKLE